VVKIRVPLTTVGRSEQSCETVRFLLRRRASIYLWYSINRACPPLSSGQLAQGYAIRSGQQSPHGIVSLIQSMSQIGATGQIDQCLFHGRNPSLSQFKDAAFDVDSRHISSNEDDISLSVGESYGSAMPRLPLRRVLWVWLRGREPH
jgi:hypothetical protein